MRKAPKVLAGVPEMRPAARSTGTGGMYPVREM